MSGFKFQDNRNAAEWDLRRDTPRFAWMTFLAGMCAGVLVLAFGLALLTVWS